MITLFLQQLLTGMYNSHITDEEKQDRELNNFPMTTSPESRGTELEPRCSYSKLNSLPAAHNPTLT